MPGHPGLVVDSSVCGVNNRCSIPERTALPSAQDVMRVYPLRNSSDSMVAFSLDIKSAHKLVVIRESDRGLLGFTLDNKIHFYKVAPFGATFSAFHWTRLGSFILRCIHFCSGGYMRDFFTSTISFSFSLRRWFFPILVQLGSAWWANRNQLIASLLNELIGE